jgi:hypothetical protein
MSKERWADMDDDGPWPEPEFVPEKKYVPPARRPRVAPRKPVDKPPPDLKETSAK